MYIDIAKYGLDNPAMRVWLEEGENGLRLAVMKYHTGISLYTAERDFDAAAAAALIREHRVGSVTGRRDLVEKLSGVLAAEYAAEYGWIFRYDGGYPAPDRETPVVRAGEEDAEEIARLIISDEGIGGYYEIEDLTRQFAERMQAGFGRNLVIRENGRIVAHYATYAEYEDIAVIGGLIVAPEQRGRHLADTLEHRLVEELRAEGYRVYSFAASELRHSLLLRRGVPMAGEYGKLVRR